MTKTSTDRAADIVSLSASSTVREGGPGSDDFAELFAAVYPSVLRTVRFITQDPVVAEEITQEAFVSLLAHWKKVSRYDRPDLWVRRAAIRRSQRETRGERRWTSGVQAVASQGRTETWRDQELMEAVGALTPRQRAIVVLFYSEELPMQVISELVGCTVASGWSQLHDARRKLAFLLADDVTDDVR